MGQKQGKSLICGICDHYMISTSYSSFFIDTSCVPKGAVFFNPWEGVEQKRRRAG